MTQVFTKQLFKYQNWRSNATAPTTNNDTQFVQNRTLQSPIIGCTGYNHATLEWNHSTVGASNITHYLLGGIGNNAIGRNGGIGLMSFYSTGLNLTSALNYNSYQIVGGVGTIFLGSRAVVIPLYGMNYLAMRMTIQNTGATKFWHGGVRVNFWQD